MNTSLHYYRAGMRGMGANPQPTTGQIASAVAGGAGTAAAQIIHGQYVSGVGTALLTAAAIPSPATPFLAIAGGVAEILGAIGIGKGCGQTCITATQFANQAGALLEQNLNTYFALPVPRAQSAQTAALNIFDQVWAALISVQACGNSSLGDAGKRCISDRQRGSCKWMTSPGPGCSPSQSNCWVQDSSGTWRFSTGGAAGSGNACWNWFIGYRDPIANDPNVVPDSAAAASSVSGAVSAVSSAVSAAGIDPTLLLIGAGVVAVLFFVGAS